MSSNQVTVSAGTMPESAKRGFIRLEKRGKAAWITLDRPEVRNAVDTAMRYDLAKALRDANADDEVRCIVLTGAGENFCAGGDVSTNKTPDDFAEYAASTARVDDEVTALKKPLITRVRGRCTAGGMAMMVNSDITVALDDSLFGLPEITVGLFPLMAMGVVAHALPHKQCWKIFCSGEIFGVEEAEKIGLVTEIATSVADLDARVQRWVDQISRSNPNSMMVGRELFNALRNRPRSEAVRLGGDAMRRMMQLNGPAPTPEYFKT